MSRFLAEDAIDLLREHTWPENVRELKAVIECAAALGESEVISRSELLHAGMFANALPSRLNDTRQGFLARRLLEVLDETSWNVGAAAEILGVHRATIYRRLERMGCQSKRGGVVPRNAGLFAFIEVRHNRHRRYSTVNCRSVATKRISA
ncbi:MAG: helix-turn-helix domain-containing protein [Gemmatimonadaceae bacterium]